jgi:RNA-directed DNA polymerase
MDARHEGTRAGRSGGEPVATKLCRIAQKARSEPTLQFNNLYHLLNVDLLRECFTELRERAAPGIDEVTKQEYAQHLEANLRALEQRLHRMAYRPQPVRRVYIPKPGTRKQRPLGIPVLEDKLVQAAMVRVLECIYEQDFIEDSYGFRPGRGCHDALRALSQTVESGAIEWLVEADIRGFFDHVDHAWMMKFVAHRVTDPRMQRMIKRFLIAGVMEAGAVQPSEEGTPQGGVISPLLANVYLHYVLDLWYTKRWRTQCQGRSRLIRYADDFVVCFSCHADAERFRQALVERLAQFGLEVEPSKTKVIAFGPQAARRAREAGQAKLESFEFLGFTHYAGRNQENTRFRMKRKTAPKRFRAKLANLTRWLQQHRARLRTRELWKAVCEKLEGHYRYYGVTDNYQSLNRFARRVQRLLFQWLNRRGGKRRMTWAKFEKMARRFPFPKIAIHVNLFKDPPQPKQGYLFPI